MRAFNSRRVWFTHPKGKSKAPIIQTFRELSNVQRVNLGIKLKKKSIKYPEQLSVNEWDIINSMEQVMKSDAVNTHLKTT